MEIMALGRGATFLERRTRYKVLTGKDCAMMRGWQTDFGQRKVLVEVAPVQRRTGAGRQPDRSMLVRVGRHPLVGPIAVDIFTVFDSSSTLCLITQR